MSNGFGVAVLHAALGDGEAGDALSPLGRFSGMSDGCDRLVSDVAECFVEVVAGEDVSLRVDEEVGVSGRVRANADLIGRYLGNDAVVWRRTEFSRPAPSLGTRLGQGLASIVLSDKFHNPANHFPVVWIALACLLVQALRRREGVVPEDPFRSDLA